MSVFVNGGSAGANFLPITGGTVSGTLETQRTHSNGTVVKTNIYPYNYTIDKQYVSSIMHNRDGADKAMFIFNENGIAFYNFISGVLSKIYGEHYKPTANDVGALPITGGTLTGALTSQQVNNGSGTFLKNHDATDDYGTQITDYDSDGKWARLYVSAKNNRVSFRRSTDEETFELYGKHNTDNLRTDANLAYKVYASLEEIGLTTGSETIANIATNLPNQSQLIFGVTASHATIYPSNYGTLIVTRSSATRIKFEFVTTGGKLFTAFYSISSNGNTWSDWKEYATTADLENAGAVKVVYGSYTGNDGTSKTFTTDGTPVYIEIHRKNDHQSWITGIKGDAFAGNHYLNSKQATTTWGTNTVKLTQKSYNEDTSASRYCFNGSGSTYVYMIMYV